MRVFLAGLLTVSAVLFTFVIVLPWLGIRPPNIVAYFLVAVTFLFAVFGACILFNRRSERWPFPSLEELENQGLVDSIRYHAKRAFQVEEFEDEGIHYYLELEDGSVLFLSGQYLYDYEPISDDPEFNQERRFPCTDFTVKRHKTGGYVLDIVTDGSVLEPEETMPPFSGFRSVEVPEDGVVIRGISYDEIKRERRKNSHVEQD